jgi:hypothetical protein
MIFGKTYAQREAAYTATLDWHDWFAWYPVRLFTGNYAWLQTVERRWVNDDGGDGYFSYWVCRVKETK